MFRSSYDDDTETRTSRGRTLTRPILVASIVFIAILALIYLLIYFPLTATLRLPFEETLKPSTTANVSTTSPATTTIDADDLYAHINDKYHRYQIPLNHVPFEYTVRLKLFIPWRTGVSFGADDFTVQGRVWMRFVSGGGPRILLHSDASEQHIGDCLVTDEFGRQITVKHVGRDHPNILDLWLSTDMISGMNYTLDVSFRGYISVEKQNGLFAVPFANYSKYIVATHLQMSEARTVFPCIDQPEAKAQFITTIIHPTGTRATANMMDNSTTVDGEWTTTQFEITPPMSTYLFAFTVSDYPYLESNSSRGILTRVFCDPAFLSSAEFTSNSIGKIIDFFEEYFEIPYPLKKLDVVILPALDVTAMENWGLITVRQAEGLYQPELYGLSQKNSVLEVISHEIAHQWFGNLVTMKWWNNLWLNEGFATMVSNRASHFIENTTIRNDEMTAARMFHILRTDQKPQSRPVSSPAEDNTSLMPESQQKIIIYRKAAIIIRMIERLIQKDIFRQGLSRFLHTFMYKNADHDDLFNVLTYVHDSSSGGHLTGQNFSLSDVMDTWLRQSSFPVVHVNRKDGSIVTLRQERYKHYPNNPKSVKDDYVWKIPIFFNDPVTRHPKVTWLTDKSSVVFDMFDEVVVDPQQLTYMRIKYDDDMYADIADALERDHELIPVYSRCRLIDDTLAMAENLQISYKIPFNITKYLRKETAYRPFQTFSAYLDFFLPRIMYTDCWPQYQEYLLALIAPLYDRFAKIGYDKSLDDEPDQSHLREIVVQRACQIGYPPCIEMTKKKFDEVRSNCSDRSQLLSGMSCNLIPFNLRSQVYMSATEYGTSDDFEFLFDKWQSESLMTERGRIFQALCATNDRNNSDRIWMTLLRNRAREDIKTRAISCSKSYKTKSLLLEMFVERASEIKKLISKAEPSFTTLLLLTSRDSSFAQLEMAKQLEDKYGSLLGPIGFQYFKGTVLSKQRWYKEIGRTWLIGNVTESLREIQKHDSIPLHI